MRNVTIRRCPTCQSIGSQTEQLTTALKRDPDLNVSVVDGSKGEYSIEVDGKKVHGLQGESFRSVQDVASEIREAATVGAV